MHIYMMSLRKQQHDTIQYIQHEIDTYSRAWVTTHNVYAYSMYTYYVQELIRIKLLILAHEQVYGFDC